MVLLGIVVYIGLLLLSKPAQALHVLARFPVAMLVPVLSLTLLNFALRFTRWHLYSRAVAAPTLRESVAIFGVGLTMAISPGRLGELVKAYLLQQSTGTPFGRGAAIVLAERLADLAAVILLSLLGTLVAVEAGLALVLGTVLVAVTVTAVCSRRVRDPLVGWAYRHRILSPLAMLLEVTGEELNKLMTPRWIAIGLGLGLAAWIAEGVGLYVVLTALGVSMPITQAISIYALSTLVGAISTLPGGLGSTEASLTALLLLSGVPVSVAGPATLLIRVCTLWFAVGVGLLAIPFVGWRRIELATSASPEEP